MPPRLGCLVVASILALLPAMRALAEPIAAHKLTDTHIRAAIASIVEELYRRRDPDRFWEPASVPSGESTTQGGGYTALAVLALLYAGETYQSPRLRDAVEYLETTSMEGTYAVALRAAVWAMLPPKFEELLRKDTAWLVEGFSERAASWYYTQRENTSYKDNSIRQYGALALWEAGKRGVKVDDRLWRTLEEAIIDCQLPDGGWNYKGDEREATGSMTTAGLATLFITQDLLHAGDAIRLTGRRSTRLDEAIERGLAWMDKNYLAIDNPGSFRDFDYYQYGIERVGMASGWKTFGGKDWFREGAAETLRRLCDWNPSTQTMTVWERTAGDSRGAQVTVRHLAFGLMFLSRGRVPVAINKLKIPNFAWNNRPRDVANLVHWISQNSETALNWQIVSIASEPQSWLDAPVLYVASDGPLPWIDQLEVDPRIHQRDVRDFHQRQARGEVPMDEQPPGLVLPPELGKIKRYLDLGGTILAVREGKSRAFSQSIETLGSLLYPEFEWTDLSKDHWAYTIHNRPTARRPPLRSLSNGVRDLIILSPSVDLAAEFQLPDGTADDSFQTASNLYFYASELNRPRARLAQHVLEEQYDATRFATTYRIARGAYEGNWNPEPAALERFAHSLNTSHDAALVVVDCPLHRVDQLTPRPDLLIVSGVGAVEPTDAQLSAIEHYVRAGGRVLIETTGGVGAFAEHFEPPLSRLFDSEVESLAGDRLIAGQGIPSGTDLTHVQYRPYSFERFGGRETTPRLRGIRVDGEARILFSREDLSNALLDQPCWGISGYSAESARALLLNLLLADK